MRYHRFGHCDKVFVKKGDIVKKGQKIATVGTGNGQYSAHLHYDIPTKEIPWTSYVFGMSLEQVKALYYSPREFRLTVLPTFDHFGWMYLQLATYGSKKCFHPGEDLNGKGSGNSDLGQPIYSACDGEVVYCFSGSGSNAGWGKLLVVKELKKEIEMIEVPIINSEKVVIADNKSNKSMQIKNTFDDETIKKIGKGALIAGGGALIIYILEFLTTMDFGDATPIIVALASILINAIKEFKKGK